MAKIKIIAATGCPTGIAHTYMAQEALQEAAKKHDVDIKVETHGQIGIENELTEEEIKDADCVIIAADKDVQAERFKNKRIIETSVGNGIKKADQLIEDAINGKGSILYPDDTYETNETYVISNSNVSEEKGSRGRKVYNHLMNGVSHMLPFVVSGGVLIALSFLFGIYSADPTSEQYNEFAHLLNTIGGTAMGLMVPILAAFIASSVGKQPALIPGFVTGMICVQGGSGFLGGIAAGFISGYVVLGLQKLLRNMPKSLDGLKAIFVLPLLSVFLSGAIVYFLNIPMTNINTSMMDFLKSFEDSNPILLGIIVGSMSAFDMGGPVNKAAYVTGTALLAQGNYKFMAGVSAACIVPPLATGFAVLLFKKYYNKNEYNAGLVNFILGSTHITEGAIPFAAKDPIRMLPSLMVGSSVAAALTYLMQVEVPAPHGGFLVLPVVNGGFKWVIAILIGSLVSALLMGYFRKKSVERINNESTK